MKKLLLAAGAAAVLSAAAYALHRKKEEETQADSNVTGLKLSKKTAYVLANEFEWQVSNEGLFNALRSSVGYLNELSDALHQVNEPTVIALFHQLLELLPDGTITTQLDETRLNLDLLKEDESVMSQLAELEAEFVEAMPSLASRLDAFADENKIATTHSS